MRVRRLGLSGFKAVNVADKPIRPKQHIFLHLVGSELLCLGEIFEHSCFLTWSFKWLTGYYHRGKNMQNQT